MSAYGLRLTLSGEDRARDPKRGTEGSICRSSWTVMTYLAQPQSKLRKPI
jgi:hypothetical protein